MSLRRQIRCLSSSAPLAFRWTLLLWSRVPCCTMPERSSIQKSFRGLVLCMNRLDSLCSCRNGFSPKSPVVASRMEHGSCRVYRLKSASSHWPISCGRASAKLIWSFSSSTNRPRGWAFHAGMSLSGSILLLRRSPRAALKELNRPGVECLPRFTLASGSGHSFSGQLAEEELLRHGVCDAADRGDGGVREDHARGAVGLGSVGERQRARCQIAADA